MKIYKEVKGSRSLILHLLLFFKQNGVGSNPIAKIYTERCN